MKNILTKFQLNFKGFKMLVASNDKWISKCLGWLILALAFAVVVRAIAPNGLL